MPAPTALIGSPGQEYFINGSTYLADGSGLIQTRVDSAGATQTNILQTDLVGLVNAGALPAFKRCRVTHFGAIAAASATVISASAAAGNGARTIAAQPDVPRQLQALLVPGAAAITAGIVTFIYDDASGTSQTEALSLVTALSVTKTLVTSHGVSKLTSATISAVAGGSSPTFQIGTNTVIALPTDAGAVSIVVNGAAMDAAAVALPTQSATDGHLVTPGTAPNAVHLYVFTYNFWSV